MRTLTLKHSGLTLSRIIAGGWQAGGDMWLDIDEQHTKAALRTAFEGGVTTFDTAEVYGRGRSEQVLRDALGDHRDEITIATKVGWTHLRREQVVKSCERSLRNLGTDRIDLYQIHWPAGTFGSELVPLSETMEALVQLRDAGKIRAIGVSNFNATLLAEACALGPVDSVQPPYSLLWRNAEQELLPWCAANNIAVLAYSPLAQGLLAGKFDANSQPSKGDNRADNRLFQAPHFAEAVAAVESLRPLAQEHGCTLAQLALWWVSQHDNVAAIAGARNEAQARDNAGAGSLSVPASVAQTMADRTAAVAKPFMDDTVMWTW